MNVEVAVCELRRRHPRWGARRISYDLSASGVESTPSRATVHRTMVRNGMVAAQNQEHRRVFERWERAGPMHLWQLDNVGGVPLAEGRWLGGVEPTDPVVLAPKLADVLGGMVDPRKRRGVRHGLIVVLTAAGCAVAAGARSFVAVAEWVTDPPGRRRAERGAPVPIGVDDPPDPGSVRSTPTGRRRDRRFVQRLCAATAPAGRRRVFGPGRKVRARLTRARRPARHLFAVIDQQPRAVLGQVQVGTVAGKGSEITAFAPLLDTLTGVDLAGVVNTADALHTQREHVADLRARGARWVLTGQRQPTSTAPPARRSAVAQERTRPSQRRDRARAAGDPHDQGRDHRGRDRLPARRPGLQITCKTRPAGTRSGRRGRWRTETAYAITDLGPRQARPDELAAWIRGHWQIENGLRWVRDVTFAEDLPQVRTGAGPQVMASLRNLVISLHRLAGAATIAAALRHHGCDARRPLRLLKIV